MGGRQGGGERGGERGGGGEDSETVRVSECGRKIRNGGGLRPEKSGVRICTRSKETLLSQE